MIDYVPTEKRVKMKNTCDKCGQDFDDEYAECPECYDDKSKIDGTKLTNKNIVSVEAHCHCHEINGKYYPAVRVMCNGRFHSNTLYGDGFDTKDKIAAIANEIVAEEARRIKLSLKVAVESIMFRVSADESEDE